MLGNPPFWLVCTTTRLLCLGFRALAPLQAPFGSFLRPEDPKRHPDRPSNPGLKAPKNPSNYQLFVRPRLLCWCLFRFLATMLSLLRPLLCSKFPRHSGLEALALGRLGLNRRVSGPGSFGFWEVLGLGFRDV